MVQVLIQGVVEEHGVEPPTAQALAKALAQVLAVDLEAVQLEYKAPKLQLAGSARFHAKANVTCELETGEPATWSCRGGPFSFTARKLNVDQAKRQARRGTHDSQVKRSRQEVEQTVRERFASSKDGCVKLGKCPVDDECVELVCRLAAQLGTRQLVLSGSKLSETALASLARLAESSPLLSRVLLHPPVQGPGCESALQALAGHTAVNALRGACSDADELRSLSGRHLGDAGAAIVAHYILSAPAPLLVTTLGLAKNGIGRAGALAVAQALLAPGAANVRLVELYSNGPDAGWARALAPVVRQSKTLESLDLGSDGVEDDDLAELVAALPGSALQELHLDYNHLTDGVAGALEAAVRASSLHTLWVHGNTFSAEATASLQAAVSWNRKRLVPRSSRGELLEEMLACAAGLPEPQDLSPRANVADQIASLAIRSYVKLLPGHAANVSGQLVVSAVVLENVALGQALVAALGVGTRFVDPLLLLSPSEQMDRDRVKDSHAEVVARRGFVRVLVRHAANLLAGGTSALVERGDGPARFRLRRGLKVHLFTSTAPCGAASTMALRPECVYGKGGGSTCSPWAAGMCKSCTDKIRRWQRDGLQSKRLTSLFERVPLHSVVVARRWSQRCELVFDGAARATELVEALVPPGQDGRGDSDACVTWSLGEMGPELYDGKTGLTVKAAPCRISPWRLDEEVAVLASLVSQRGSECAGQA